MLSPNALRILESHNLYTKLSQQGYSFETVAFQNDQGKTTDSYYLGSEQLYEYKALRVYRQVLLDELRQKVTELAIPIVYGKKFTRVLSESTEGVVFEFADGTTEKADLLVGADGIHSTVRKHIASDVTPKYSGTVAITCAIQKSKLNFPQSPTEYYMPVSIYGKAGAFVMAPQDVTGSEVLAGTQIKYPEQDRAGWDAFLANKEQLLELLRANYGTWPRIVQSALDNVPTETLGIWPYYVVPKLADWTSPGPNKRVIIIGDAAHAIPPTAGQGASQGFEDSFTLAALLANVSPEAPLEESLGWWKNMRQERVDQVIALTLQLNNARLPQAEREKLTTSQAWQSGDAGELAWLYNRRIEEDVLGYMNGRK